MIRQAHESSSSRWAGVGWGCVVGGGLVGLIILVVYLDVEGFIPPWMKKVPKRVWILGGTVIFFIVWWMRGLTFGEMKLIVRSLLGMGPSSRFRKPSDENK